MTELIYRIKENIKAIENGDLSEDRLDEVRSDFLEMLELIKLFLISERDSYYGYFLMNMQFSVNFRENTIAGIKLNTFPPVFESNPLLLCKYTIKEIIYIVCHEIDHIVLNHPALMIKSNQEKDPDTFYLFNLAADASVNDRLNHEIKAEKHGFMSTPDGLITSDVIAEICGIKSIAAMESYAYYFNLLKRAGTKPPEDEGNRQENEGNRQEAIGSSKSSTDGEQESEGGEQESEGGEQESEDGEQPSATDIVTAKNQGKRKDHDWGTEDDAESAAELVKELVNAAVDMMSEESRGLMPGSFMSEVEKINRPPEIPWQAVLKKYVGTITANKTKTRMRLNRRQPERFDLSGERDDKVLKIVVAIDTSGSVSDAMLSYIFNEIFAILAKRKHDITVIECDAAVRRVYKARTRGDIKLKAAGRGGTWFSPVIEYINKDKYYRDALLIYFTDGYGEREIPRPRTYRNMWVVFNDNRNLSVKEPYGAVLELKNG